MDPDMRQLSLGLDKKIENLLIVIRSVGKSLHFVQQACISNLLVTVFAAPRLDTSSNTDIFSTLFNFSYGSPTRKELTAIAHAGLANTAP
jgi:hypothetical protein